MNEENTGAAMPTDDAAAETPATEAAPEAAPAEGGEAATEAAPAEGGEETPAA